METRKGGGALKTDKSAAQVAEIPSLAAFLGPSLTFQSYTHHLPLIPAAFTSPLFRKPCRHAKDPLCCHPYIGHCRYVLILILLN